LSAGYDHLLALDKNGEVFAMGDDTYGNIYNNNILKLIYYVLAFFYKIFILPTLY